MKGLFDNPGNVVYIRNQIIVLGAGTCDPDNIYFLKGVISDQTGRHLTGNHHDRHRIKIGRRNAGNRVRGTGAGCHQTDPYTPGGTGIRVRGMDRTLLMTHQDMPDIRFRQLIIDIQNRPARITEDVIHAFFF